MQHNPHRCLCRTSPGSRCVICQLNGANVPPVKSPRHPTARCRGRNICATLGLVEPSQQSPKRMTVKQEHKARHASRGHVWPCH
eukprot:31737-Eustigmatos_ZCMA.PRE.1